ncbi:MAG: TlpA family protein disulfide reductase [Spirochaetales bacterium]|nr:TlpA family protein disulfide reductase [Spirochaetales bacterium]
MKLSIFIFCAVVLILACASEERAAASMIRFDAPSQFIQVDFTPEADQNLKRIGFVLPSAPVKAPDFSLKGLDGSTHSLSSYRGKLVLLNFWGVWCYYCRLEMPSLQRFYSRFKADGLEILAVDVRDTPETVRDFIKKNKYTFPVLLDETLSVTGMYGVGSFPTTFVVDREGYLRAMATGAADWENPAIVAVFNKILGRSSPAGAGREESGFSPPSGQIR